MSIELADYMHHLDEYDMTDEQKMAYLKAMELVMQSFVDLAWGTDPTQLAMGITLENNPDPAADGVKSDRSTTPPFNDAARQERGR